MFLQRVQASQQHGWSSHHASFMEGAPRTMVNHQRVMALEGEGSNWTKHDQAAFC